jgi:hypothetical protein
MNPKQERKILLCAMTVCIVVSVILAGALTADHFDHHCQTCKVPDCPICQRIEMAEIFIKILKLVSIVLFLTGCFVFFVQIADAHTTHASYLLSPVALKVRFNS